MNKSVLSSVTLAFSVMLILGGCATMYDPDFGTTVGQSAAVLGLGLVLAFVTWRLRVGVGKEQAAAEAKRQEEFQRQREAKLQHIRDLRKQAEQPFVRTASNIVRSRAYAVAGVTFQNEDGTSRQDILRDICEGGDGGSAWAWLEWYQYKSEDAYHVMTARGCVGSLHKEDIREVLPALGAENAELDVELFETDDGRQIYRADLIL